MNASRYSPASASMICSSCPVPSVATQKACVSPRVNRALPWARGSTPTSGAIGQLDDTLYDRLEALVAEGDGAEHHVFRELMRLGFHHQHAFLRARDHEV